MRTAAMTGGMAPSSADSYSLRLACTWGSPGLRDSIARMPTPSVLTTSGVLRGQYPSLYHTSR